MIRTHHQQPTLWTGFLKEEVSDLWEPWMRSADQILVFADGGIVERGTHDQLVAAAGVYAELYRTQLLEEELAAS